MSFSAPIFLRAGVEGGEGCLCLPYLVYSVALIYRPESYLKQWKKARSRGRSGSKGGQRSAQGVKAGFFASGLFLHKKTTTTDRQGSPGRPVGVRVRARKKKVQKKGRERWNSPAIKSPRNNRYSCTKDIRLQYIPQIFRRYSTDIPHPVEKSRDLC